MGKSVNAVTGKGAMLVIAASHGESGRIASSVPNGGMEERIGAVREISEARGGNE